jgi:hypothetical protein
VLILFRQRKLAQKLHEDAVTEKQQIYYLILYSLVTVLYVMMSRNEGRPEGHYNVYDFISDGVTILYTVASILYLFSLNKKGDGRNFLVRYICLAIPITVKMFLLALPLGVAVFFLDNPAIVSAASASGKNQKAFDEALNHIATGPYTCIAVVACLLFCFFLYRNAFRIASGQSDGRGDSVLSVFGSDEGAGAM